MNSLSINKFYSITISIIVLILLTLPTIGTAIFSEMIFQKISIDYTFTYASLVEETDSSDVGVNEREKSDLFYYILGIVILISAGIIFKQRYAQYLKDKDRLNL